MESGSIDFALSPQQVTIGSLLAHVRRGDVGRVHSLRRGAAEASAPGGGVRFRITIMADGGDGSPQDVVIEGPTLAAALILHCKIRQIPLPAGGEKSLQCFGEQLGLVVATGSKYDRSAQSAQLHL